MKKLTTIILVCVAICLVMAGCSKTKSEEPRDIFKESERLSSDESSSIQKTGSDDAESISDDSKAVTLGEVNGNTYSNDYFGLTFTFPDNWEKISPIETLEMFTKGHNKIDQSEEINLDEQSMLWLFHGAKAESGPTNSIMVDAYKIGSVDRIYGEITTAEKFLKDQAEDSKVDIFGEESYYESSDIKEAKLGSKEALYLEISLPFNIERNYLYACESNGYILLFQFSNIRDEAAKNDAESVIQSINFK